MMLVSRVSYLAFATIYTSRESKNLLHIDTNKLSDTAKFIRDNIIAHPEKFGHQPLGKILDLFPFKVKPYTFGFGCKVGTIKNLILFLSHRSQFLIS